MSRNVLILGAAGRDFHNFNTRYRNKEGYRVVAFTAAQIPDIEDRVYPATLAGARYPDGISIFPESELERLIKELNVHECVFAYSDVSYRHVMSTAARVSAAGATFLLLGPDDTMIESKKPVISVCASRTGAGKSQTSRFIIEFLMRQGVKVVAIRHPMPYGDLEKQRVQRFATLSDLEKYNCTIEEMEEFEPHIHRGNVIYAGVDYEAILDAAENDENGCDIILWDGGNNDFSFYRSDLYITLLDPHRPGDELSFYPGEINLRLADVCLINKTDSAPAEGIAQVRRNIRIANPDAKIVEAASPIRVDNPELIKDKRVLVVEDGPTLTHGGMKLGAGTLAAQRFGAREIVDPRKYAVGKVRQTFEQYPDIGHLLPAMGYGEEQIKDLARTIRETDCDAVIIGTPIDLNRLFHIDQPNTRVYYDLQETGEPSLEVILSQFLAKAGIK